MSAGGAPFAFVDDALDRADPLRDDGDVLATLWPRARVVLVDADGRALADAGGNLWAPTGAELGGGVGNAIFLGRRGEQPWFALAAETVAAQSAGRIDLRRAAASWPAFEATLFAQSRALLHWRARHRRCGACGAEVGFERAGWLGRCPGCGLEHYPRTDPAVIVSVSDGERLLLGRQAGWPPRRWSVIAGFVEPGESLEQAVAREVHEETGVRVREARYLASQPWPFPGALMLGFTATAEADAPVAGDELEDARWFTAAQVRAGLERDETVPFADDDDGILLSPSISISRWLIEQWLAAAEAAPPR